MAAIDNQMNPDEITLEKKDSQRLLKSTNLQPKPQCRVDTMVAGLLCPVNETIDFSNKSPNVGACLHSSVDSQVRAGARPRCWYRPPTELYRCSSLERIPFHNSSTPENGYRLLMRSYLIN